MKIITYRTEMGRDRQNILVRESETEYECESVDNPGKASSLLNDVFHADRFAEEHLFVIAMSARTRLMGVFDVSHGTSEMAAVRPREVFVRLLLVGASHFMVAHNHPSGDPFPSQEDRDLTKRLQECGNLMGIALLDHVIIGEHYYSFMEGGML